MALTWNKTIKQINTVQNKAQYTHISGSQTLWQAIRLIANSVEIFTAYTIYYKISNPNYKYCRRNLKRFLVTIYSSEIVCYTES